MANNTTYKFTKQLPSIHVNLDLIKTLEDYFLNKIPTILNVSKKVLKEKFEITIEEKSGQETISSISDFNLISFPDDTNKILLGIYWNDWDKDESASIKIYLDSDKIGAKISTDIKRNNPKEITQGIISSLMEILSQNKSINHLFHLSIIVESLLIGIGLVAFMSFPIIWIYRVKYSLLSLSIALIILFHQFSLKKLKPYISFDSNKQRRYDKNTNWFLYSLFAFIIFGNFFVFLKDKFFG